jgi:isochorismate pyruvate lyase
MKQAKDCENMSDIRTEIDALDRQIVHLIGQRAAYVKAAAKFKTSETAVKAPERLYTDLVNHFIEEEMKHWKNKP